MVAQGLGDFFRGGDENVQKLNVVMVAQLCQYAKHRWIMPYFNYILIIPYFSSVVCELYLNKAITKKSNGLREGIGDRISAGYLSQWVFLNL